MLIALLSGINQGLCSHLRCSQQKATILAVKALISVFMFNFRHSLKSIYTVLVQAPFRDGDYSNLRCIF